MREAPRTSSSDGPVKSSPGAGSPAMSGARGKGEHLLQEPEKRDAPKSEPASIKQDKPASEDKAKETPTCSASSLGPFDKRGRNEDGADNDRIITRDKRYVNALAPTYIFITKIFSSFVFLLLCLMLSLTKALRLTMD